MRFLLVALAAAGFLGIPVFVALEADAPGGAPSAAAAATAAEDQPDKALMCGVERWAIKTASDPDAMRITRHAVRTSVAALGAQGRPATVGPRLPRQPLERKTFRLTNVELHAVRYVGRSSEDRDLHLVVGDRGTNTSMIVEFADPLCAGADRSPLLQRMTVARAAFERECGGLPPTRFLALAGRATIVGVGFYDRRHGQLGAAPNGVELHPVLSFRSRDCRQAR